MDFYKEIVIIKKIPIPFSEARNDIVWKVSKGVSKVITTLVDEHIYNILNRLLAFNSYQYNYANHSFYTYKEWINIFKLELEFRDKIRKQTSLSLLK